MAEGPCAEADQACAGDTSHARNGTTKQTQNKKAKTTNHTNLGQELTAIRDVTACTNRSTTSRRT